MSIQMRTLFVTLLLSVTGTAWAIQPLTATLDLLPASTLPGLPVAFVLNVTNQSDQSQTLSDVLRLEVSAEAGTFLACGGDAHRTGISITSTAAAMRSCDGRSCLAIPPHGHRELYVNYDATLTGNEFFADQRLNQPGAYRLTAIFFGGEPAVEVRTNTATLTVRQPTGIDAEAYNYLNANAFSKGVWTSMDWGLNQRIANEIRKKFAGSSYTEWAAAVGLDDPIHAPDSIEAALANNPNFSLRDNLLWALGTCLEGMAQYEVLNERDADKAADLADRATAAFRNLRAVAATDTMRGVAEKELRKLDSLTSQTYRQAVAALTENDPPAPEKIVPTVKCIVKLSGDSFSARFGYSNPNKVAKWLPVGVLNKVTPAPQDQQQPRKFLAGTHEDVFTATSPGGDLIWHLDGNTAAATLASVPCAAP